MKQVKKNLPKRRFKEFQNAPAWEQRKLGEIYEFSKGKGVALDSFRNYGTLAIAYGHLYTRYSEVINVISSRSIDTGVKSKTGDILFPGSSTVPNGTCQASALMIDNVELGGDIIIARSSQEQLYAPYVSYMINAQKNKLFPITTGTTITHMYGKDIAELKYLFSNISEQIAIGNLFENIDSLITLHQRKLDKLKSQKQAYFWGCFSELNDR